MHTCHIATGWSIEVSAMGNKMNSGLPSSNQASTSNFHIFSPGSLVLNSKFEKSSNKRFFSTGQKIPSTPTDIKYEMI